jgi:WD40 repeat protein
VESLKEEPTPQGTEIDHRALSIMPTSLQTFDVYEGSSIDLSEDGRVLAATLPSGDIKVWDVATGGALLTVTEPVDSRPEIAISGDGRILARSRSAEGNQHPRVIVTEVATGRELSNIELSLPPLNIALSPDGAQLVVADRKQIQLFDARRATLVATLAPQRGNAQTGGFSQNLKFDSTGQHVAVLWGGVVEVLPTTAGDGARTTHAVTKLEDDSRILSAVSGDGRRVAAGDSTGTIQVWDTETLTEVSRVEHGNSYVQAVALSASGDSLAGVSRRGKLTVWLLPEGAMQMVMAGPPRWRSNVDHHITLTGDGDFRVAVSNDWVSINSIVASGSTLRFPISTSSSAVAANRDGSRIAVSDAYNFARIYDTRSGQEIARVTTPAEDFGGIVDALALSGDGSRLAVGGDFEIVRVFDVSTGKLLLKLSGNRGPAERKAVFALDDAGQRLAVVSPEGTLTVLPLDGSRPQTTRDLASPVDRLAFSQNREYLVLDGLDSTIRVLDAISLEERARIPHQLNVAAVTFAADNTRVRVALYDGSVRQSQWRPQDLIAQACSVIGRNFTKSEWPRYFPDQPFRPICAR